MRCAGCKLMPSQFSTSWISSTAPPLRPPTGYVMHPAASKPLHNTMVSGAPHNGRLSDSVMASRISALSKTMMQSSHMRLPRKKKNGVVVGTAPPPPSPPPSPAEHKAPQIEGRHSSPPTATTTTTTTLGSNCGRLVCPELAVGYTSSIISERGGQLLSSQYNVEARLTSLQRRLCKRQLSVVHSHAKRQLEYDSTKYSPPQRRRKSSGSHSLTSVCTTESLVDIEMMECEFPLQVDGPSDDAFLTPRGEFQRHVSLATTSSEGTRTGDESMYDMEFEGTVSTAARIRQRMDELGGLVDEEMTEGSSDEEEEEEGTQALR